MSEHLKSLVRNRISFRESERSNKKRTRLVNVIEQRLFIRGELCVQAITFPSVRVSSDTLRWVIKNKRSLLYNSIGTREDFFVFRKRLDSYSRIISADSLREAVDIYFGTKEA